MKTHIPAKLRKALLAALFATAATSYNAYGVVDIINKSTGYAKTSPMDVKEYSTGYTDLTFSGTNETLGTVTHWCHDGDVLGVDHNQGESTYITLATDAAGKFVAHSVVANRGVDDNSTIVDPYHDCSDTTAEFGYSKSWSNGNINVSNSAVLVVGSTLSANGTLNVGGASRVTSEGAVKAGAINVSEKGTEFTARTITVKKNDLWKIEGGKVKNDKSSGVLKLENQAVVTATDRIDAVEVEVDSATLNAGNIKADAMRGSKGTIKALPDQDLKVDAKILTENAHYVASDGHAIHLSGIGALENEGTDDTPDMVMHGNGNYIGYSADDQSIKASLVRVNGDVASDSNKIAATGANLVADVPAVFISGNVSGNENSILASDGGGIQVQGGVTGDNNNLRVEWDGDLIIEGTVGRFGETAPAMGNTLYALDNISIGSLADNSELNITADDGGVSIQNVSEATLTDSSILAADDVEIAIGTPGSTKELKLVRTNVTSEEGDITVNQVLVAENATLTAENGKITVESLDAKSSSVYAEDLEGKSIELDANGSKDAEVVVTGNMASTEKSISIKGYNGEAPRVTVGGNMTAMQDLGIENSNVTVGHVDEETGEVIGGNQTAGKNIEIANSIVEALGSQEATNGAISITGGSKVTVASQTAKGNITIEDSNVSSAGNQTAREGSIHISSTKESTTPSVVTVGGDQKAGIQIKVEDSTLTVGSMEKTEDEKGEITYELHGGNQTADSEDILISGSKVTVLRDQVSTEGNIDISKGSDLVVGAIAPDGEILHEGNQTAKMDISISDSKVTVLNDQTATEGNISIVDKDGADGKPTKVAVDGNQLAGRGIKVENAKLTVGVIEEIEDEKGEITYELHGGNQTATTEDIAIANSIVDVLGDQEAVAGSISVSGSTLAVGAIAESGEIVYEGNQRAKKDISITDSKVWVLNHQTATEGSISIVDKDGADGKPTEVIVEGNQLAGKGIKVENAKLTVGIIEEIEDEKGNITYELHGGNQTANTEDIAITSSTVNVMGDQEAVGGSIRVAGSTLTVGATAGSGEIVHEGNQRANQDITLEDSTVTVLGNEMAYNNITVTDSILNVGGNQTAVDGSVVIKTSEKAGATPSDVTIGGNQQAGQGIEVDGAKLTVGIIEETPGPWGLPIYTLHGGMQTADSGNISISRSTVNILGDQTAAQGAISITKGSELTVGSLAPNGMLLHAGNQKAATDITISDSKVNVLGDQIATTGKIAISVTDPDKYTAIVNVDGNQHAGAGISVDDSTLTVGIIREFKDFYGQTHHWLTGGNQTADTEDIAITNSTVNVLGNQDAVAGNITVAGSTLTVGAKTDDGKIVQRSNQTANQDITIVDSTVTVLGDQKATDGSIAISSTPGTGITSEVTVGGDQEAGNAISVTGSQLKVGTAEIVTDEETGEQHVVLTGGNQTAGTGDIAIANSTVEVLGDQTATEGGIKIDKFSLVTIGTADVDGKALAGNQLAKQDIEVDSSTLMVFADQTSQEGSISVQALEDYSVVMVGGNQKAKQNISVMGSKEFDAPTTMLVGGDQISEEGNIAINDAQVSVNGKVVALGDGNDGTGIVALAGATYSVGTSLEAKELNIGTIDNPTEVTINVGSLDADGNPLNTVLDVDKLTVAEGNTLHTGNVEMDAADVAIHGTVVAGVKDTEDPTKDIAADWKVTGSHDISGENAQLMANGDIEIVAAEEGDTIRIADGAKVSATGDVTIQGLAAVLAEVDNATVRAKGDITFDNAELTNNHETDITTKGGNIVLKNRVEISDTILNVLPPEEGEAGVINVAEGADVQLYQGTVDVFNGKLAGKGSVTANDENLTLYHDATAFNGTINLVRDNEQALNIACAGVGDEAVINLKEGSSLYTIVGGQGAHLGNVVTTDRSHIQLTAVEKGNTATATSLSLTSGTTYDVLATADDNGDLLSDNITVSNGIDANGAKVAAHTTDEMSTMAEGSRFSIATGNVVSAFNEDVAYDMLRDAHGVSSLRKLQTRNLHLEHTAQGVDLVVSENYKGINTNNANVNAVREVIMPLDAAADHRPGKLAESTSNLDHILDALDYTRSGADAKAGLLNVSAATNLIVPNMMMDASRHHLSTLRDHMATPVCTKDFKGKGNVWASYTGGHDFIGGDDNLGKYSHSYQGAIVGGDYAINCNWAVGASVGYQKSIARAEATRADADIISADLYAVGRTGRYTHRFSMGLASYSTDVNRTTRIAAKGHGYNAMSTGDAGGMSWNFGYQLSRSYAINEVSSITPYLTVDVALQRIDTMTEKGQGDASVVTDYEDFVQTDAALGVAYSHTFASFNRQAGVFSVDLAVHGEFSEHRATAMNRFVGSADEWKTRSMKRAPFYGEVGASVIVPFTQHVSGTAGMSFEFSDDRTYVGGHAGVNYRF